MQTETVTQEPIAIIGLGCVLPDAPDVETFWNHLLQGRSSIRPVDAERWDPALHWNEDKSIPDKTYAKIGGFVADDGFQGLDYRLPPKVVEQIDPSQRWALSASRQAFLDAGYATGLRGDEGREFDRDRCAVILGNAMGGENNKQSTRRLSWSEAARAIREDPDFQALPEETRDGILRRTEERYKALTLPITEDSMPGHLSNVVAGRIANTFDLAGKNFTTDAACASSLAALDAAVDTLRTDDADLVVWGGSDRSMDVSAYVQFSKIGALSPDGSRPFDKDANGFVMGEGCAMFLLKRLSDAERDGDRIYAVVRGIGGSSDGKGKGITAPNPAGQVKAIRRAYEDAGIDPATIGYLEAHGTSTPVGDPVELESVMTAFQDVDGKAPEPGSILVGSVKSNIGHLKAAAGAAGMLKAVLSLHHGRVPPSINVQELNPRIDWANSPFRVATVDSEWPQPAETPRRAGVSSFGFGGTNFHIVLEQHVPGHLQVAATTARATGPTPTMEAARPPTDAPGPAPTTEEATVLDTAAFQEHMAGATGLEAEPLVLDEADAPKALELSTPTFPEDGKGARLRDLLRPLTEAGLRAERRVAFHVDDVAEIPKRLAMAQKAASDPAAARLAFNQGIHLGQGTPDGKVAFLFPGQGTQYVNMGRDLAQKYAVVRNTFEEADEALFDELDGVKLTDILWPTPDTGENRQASEEKLKLTEFTQPAVLAMDVALLRLLRQWGMAPDVVAGHSLGEYGALVAAGVLSFSDALHAVAARGREMAHVEVPDLGKMASVPADWETVQAALEEVDGYVICANKNCPSQTVIAGSTDGVDQAVARLTAQGLQCIPLPVSAAFHSKIVAPASEPLRRVLGRLDVHSPKVRTLSNVGAAPYPDDPDAIRDNLAVQVASPVAWTDIVERMYDEGVRTFIEVGPKRALTGFVADTLKDRDDVRPVFANHPKKGGIQSLNELYAFLGAGGHRPTLPPLDDASVYTATFRDPAAPYRHAAPAPSSATPTGPAAPSGSPADPAQDPRIDTIAKHLDALSQELAALRGAPAMQPAQKTGAQTPTPARTDGDGTAPTGGTSRPVLSPIGVSGISVGLPGRNKPFFAEDDWDRILRGENLIDVLDDDDRHAMAAKHITRLVKSSGGQGTFEGIDDPDQVIKLAGRRGDFDLHDWGVGDDLLETLDVTSQYAIAAGLEALRDAGLPLQRTYKQTSTGGRLPQGWALPRSVGDRTGVIFASAFPGYDALLEEVKKAGTKEAFNRKFLFHVLSMGHAQLAQFLGARGPNTQVNAACASTTQAVAIAEDWIKADRCDRVLVVGADDATSPNLMEWIGSGFLASGAATTKEDVAEAALPFDARRHGMIIGMGAVGLVVEKETATEERGMRPVARLLATQISNSAYHGSRLDVDHIAAEMRTLVRRACENKALASGDGLAGSPESLADSVLFMSHETYTPARGGSAAAEIHALRATFGDAAGKVVVANTKGFTGHPQGAGIEDAVALKCLQRGQVPPIPHLMEPDPELGDLNLSKGGEYDVRYALRLAAGFGSQVAMTFTELVAREDERVADPDRYDAWLSQVSGLPGAATEVANRTLRIIDQGAPEKPVPEPVPQEAAPVATPSTAPATAPAAGDGEVVLEKVTAVVAEKTGYPLELLEADLDLEADLGIDTVKQAELFGELRDHFGVPLDESLQLKDYNTLRKVAGYMGGEGSRSEPSPSEPQGETVQSDASPSEGTLDDALASSAATAGDPDAALEKVTKVVADKTGYPAEMLEADLDLEADLGIDTVKQAELFGELREMFGVPLDESLQLKDYNTLRKVAGYMGGDGAQSEPPLSQPEEEPVQGGDPAGESTPADPSATDVPEEVLAKVTTMVADKTGYPAEMLEADLDLEADLGIDTVKQAELFGELRDHFGVPLDESLQLKDYNTLRKVAGYMGATGAQRAAVAGTSEPQAELVQEDGTRPEADTEDGTPSDGPAGADIVRRVPTLRPDPRPDIANDVPKGPVRMVGLATDEELAPWKETGFEIHQDHDDPVGILCIATRPGQDAGEAAGQLFAAAKAHPDARFIAVVTAQDGAHGLRAPRDPAMAALAGLTKALRKERPGATVKAIDLDPDQPRMMEAVHELRRGGPRTEVCYDGNGTRFVVEVAPEPLEAATPDVAGKAFVVAGGAQGITAELLARMAPQGPRLLLLGRTPLPEEAMGWADWSDEEWKAEETRTIEALKEEGEKPTPVKVQARVDKKRKAAEVQRNVARLMDAGAEVLYAPVDVLDAASLSDAIAWGRSEFGALHGVIHAAGIEVSKPLDDKPRDQFDRVFAIKHQGLQNLLAATADDDLEWLVGFGSVAGRFGNLGQTDYAAANEALAKSIVQTARERGIRTAFTVAWGPWGELGMATRGSIMTVLKQSGVTPIPTEDGAAAFLAEMAHGGARESVVAGEIGMLDGDQQVVETAWDPAVAEARSWLQTAPERFRLLADIDAFHPGKTVRATVRLDRSNDPYLTDHAIDGTPLLPGVFGIEAFAEAARLLAPEDQTLLGADDVRFSAPLKQHKDPPVDATLDAHVDASGDATRVRCRLTSRFIGPDGEPHGDPRTHFEATLRFGEAPEPLQTGDVPVCDDSLSGDAIYPPFFHGPSFQVLAGAGPMNDAEAIGAWTRPDAPLFAAGEADFLSHPLVMEGLFQLCGLRTMQKESAMTLPAAVERLDVFETPSPPTQARLWCRFKDRGEDGLRRFDAAACTPEGQVLVRMVGYAMVETGPVPAEEPAEGPIPAGDAESSTPSLTDFHDETTADDGTDSDEGSPTDEAGPVDDETPDLPVVDGVLFAAQRVGDGPDGRGRLTAEEQDQASSFSSRKRAAEWVAGRLAVKDAVRQAAPDLTDPEITVDGAEGPPRLLVRGEASPATLSITHRDGWAVAAVADDGLGIDLETVEPRADPFWDQAFGADEQERLQALGDDDLAAACAWAAKEACLKRAGTGLTRSVHALQVHPDDAGGATVEGPFGAWGVRFYDIQGRVLAVTLPAFDAAAPTAPPPSGAKA